MPWKPSFRGEVPSLGWYVLDWMAENLGMPDRGDYEPFTPTQEQAEFILRFYELDRRTGRRVVRRAVLSRPRGWGKSPFVSALCIVEGLAEVVPDGWDAAGQPVGKPWSEVRTPIVQLAAVSEAQTGNAWRPLLEMLREDAPVFDNYPGLEPLGSFVNLPRGRIEPITASATTVKGNKPVFAALDQTEEWVKSNGGVRLASTMRINAAKIGGSLIETPNAFTPGRESVAENSAAAWKSMLEGKTRTDRGLMVDHREAPGDTDLSDRQSLVAGLRFAYGDSSDHPDGCVIHEPPCEPGWSPIAGIVATIWDPDNDPQTSRADFLNQITHAADAWLSQPEWAARIDATKIVADRDAIVLGFDGSRARKRGVTDSTALVAIRLSDGHMWVHGIWEQPDGVAGKGWEIPAPEVDASVHDAFQRYRVVGLYADPALWESYLAAWEARYNNRLKVRASRDHPMSWWINAGRSRIVERAVSQLHSAIVNGEMTHDGGFALTRHFLNARNRPGPSGGQWIGKEHPESARKVDAAWAGVAAYAAYLDAKAAGIKAGTPGKGRAIALN